MMKRSTLLRAFISQQRSPIWLIVALILLGSGLYVVSLLLAPIRGAAPFVSSGWNQPVQQGMLHDQRLYIPRLQLNLPYAAGDESVLNDAVWHRYPERGDPEKGGNFILAGHRFVMGLTPGETRRKSPFYAINTVKVGDYLYVDFNGRRYQYEVTRHYEVKPTQVDIEAESVQPKMTLYTCTFGGETDGRDVLEAKLVQKDVDPTHPLVVNKP